MRIYPLIAAAVLCLAGGALAQTAAAPDVAAAMSRTEHHRAMAEKRITEHMAMTAAHIAGREPICPAADVYAPDATFFTPAFGEGKAMASTDGADHISLNELRMYWQKIGDFGIKRYEIFPSESGWLQVLYWNGHNQEGKLVEAQEADLFHTDKDFRITRTENIHDWAQWQALAAYANGKDPATFDKAAYGAAIMAQAKSPTEVCRPKYMK